MTPNEIAEFAVLGLPSSLNVRVPTLVVAGSKDAAFCPDGRAPGGPTFTLEPTFYPPEACLETLQAPGAGHDLNLGGDQRWFTEAQDWVGRRVGADAATAPTKPCRT